MCMSTASVPLVGKVFCFWHNGHTILDLGHPLAYLSKSLEIQAKICTQSLTLTLFTHVVVRPGGYGASCFDGSLNSHRHDCRVWRPSHSRTSDKLVLQSELGHLLVRVNL